MSPPTAMVASPSAYTDVRGMQAMARGGASNDPEHIAAVAREFESMFVSMMIKSMRDANKAIVGEHYLANDKTRFHEDMLDSQLAVDMAKHGGIGLAQEIIREMGGERPPTLDAGPAQPIRRSAVPTRLSASPVAADLQEVAEAGSNRRSMFVDEQSFVKSLAPLVESVVGPDQEKIARVVGHAALETGWGQRVIHDGQGNSSHNLFGIKSSRADQDAVSISTLEFDGVALRPQEHSFRHYSGFREAVEDYAQLLRNARYEGADKAQDARAYADEITQGGYATDPEYGAKLVRVIDSVQTMMTEFGGSP